MHSTTNDDIILGSQKVVVELKDKSKQPSKSSEGHVRGIQGKKATVQLTSGSLNGSKIKSVYTIGKEEPTIAEVERTAVVLSLLQDDSSFFQIPVVRKILSSSTSTSQRRHGQNGLSATMSHLNPSQREAVNAILSPRDEDTVVLIHGPPGTGKTTVIATAVIDMVDHAAKSTMGIWLVAQSNVAVKNIAEKLASLDFLDFKLLVSKDFHFDWSECSLPCSRDSDADGLLYKARASISED